jgi:hypothetical protein
VCVCEDGRHESDGDGLDSLWGSIGLFVGSKLALESEVYLSRVVVEAVVSGPQ